MYRLQMGWNPSGGRARYSPRGGPCSTGAGFRPRPAPWSRASIRQGGVRPRSSPSSAPRARREHRRIGCGVAAGPSLRWLRHCASRARTAIRWCAAALLICGPATAPASSPSDSGRMPDPQRRDLARASPGAPRARGARIASSWLLGRDRRCASRSPRRHSRAGSPRTASRRRRRARRGAARSRSRRRARAGRRSSRPTSRRRRRACAARSSSARPPRARRSRRAARPPSRSVARSSRCGDRGPESEPGAEQRPAQVGAAAARAADDALGRAARAGAPRPRARRPRGRPRPRPRRPRRGAGSGLRGSNGVPAVGADLRADAEVAEQREGAPGRGRAREIEVHGELAAAAQVPGAGASGRAPRARRAGSSGGRARSRRARRGGRQRTTSSSASSRRL